MRQTIACLLVLTLSFIGCTTVMNVRGIGGFHSPEQGNGSELEIKIRGGNGVDKDTISVDRVTDLPVQTASEEIIQDEMPIAGTLIVALIVSSIVRDIFSSIPYL